MAPRIQNPEPKILWESVMINIRVKAKRENATKTVVKARKFELIVDEPSEIGGTNEGANPLEFLLAGFAGCINVVGDIVAKEMGIELRGMDITIRGKFDPMKFLGQSGEGRAGFQEINMNVKADADADRETLEKWLQEVENRCPVRDNLSNLTPIKVKLSK